MSDARNLTVAIAQYACSDDVEANLTTAERYIAEAGAAGARLVLLPELHNTPYFCQREDPAIFDYAEPVPGPSSQRLAAAAKAAGVVVVASLFERRAPGLYHNTAIVLDRDGTMAGRYRKMHIPDDPEYYEKYYFTPGDLGFEPIDTSIGRLGVLVCWDQWYPEAARLMALAGAELLIYPSAIGWDDATDDAAEQARQLGAWQGVQRGHAIANHLPVVTSNRVGVRRRQPHRNPLLGPQLRVRSPGRDRWPRPAKPPNCWSRNSICIALKRCDVSGRSFVIAVSMRSAI